jgi:hypothetical protein
MSHPKPHAPCPAPRVLSAPRARRSILSFGAAALLAGCNARSFEDAGDALHLAMFGQPDVPVTRAQVLDIPYATIRAKVGKGQRSVLVLFRYDGPDLHWVSADRIVFTTRKGRLVRTAGLPSDLRHSEILGLDPTIAGLSGIEGPVALRRLVDIEPGSRYGIPIRSTIAPEGPERIEIVERTYETVRFRERCVAEPLDWTFDNVFWADRRNGFVWRSLQHFTPDLPPVEIEILKAAA